LRISGSGLAALPVSERIISTGTFRSLTLVLIIFALYFADLRETGCLGRFEVVLDEKQIVPRVIFFPERGARHFEALESGGDDEIGEAICSGSDASKGFDSI
jgi:hypothetical protein